jgi:hypothetical protein
MFIYIRFILILSTHLRLGPPSAFIKLNFNIREYYILRCDVFCDHYRRFGEHTAILNMDKYVPLVVENLPGYMASHRRHQFRSHRSEKLKTPQSTENGNWEGES